MKDKLDDLIPWLDKLLATFANANPTEDPDELKRRSELAKFVSPLRPLFRLWLILGYRSLGGIERRSLAMSEKGKIARVIDKSRDSGEVVKLVEDLRRAILVYQVGIRHHPGPGSLTRGAGVATTIDIQSSRPPHCEFVLLIFDYESDLLIDYIKSSFDALLKMRQVREYVCGRGH